MTDLVVSGLPWEPFDLMNNFNRLKMLFYGETFVGKTILTGSISEIAGPTLYLELEEGSTSLAAVGYTDKEKITALQVTSIDETNTFTPPKPYTKARDFLIKNNTAFKSVIIDSMTEFQNKYIRELCKKQNKAHAEQHMWNTIGARMAEEVEIIKSMNMHVLMTALEKKKEDPKTKIMKSHPAIKGMAMAELEAKLDVIGYCTYQMVEGSMHRIVQFHGTDQFVAKDRTQALPAYMVDPTMEKIFELISKKHDLT